MTKLNQIIAIVNGKKTETQKSLTDVYKKVQKTELFNGLQRSYTPNQDDGDKLPPENKMVQYTVQDCVKEFGGFAAPLMDIIATQEYANTKAVADVVVDNKTLLKDVPVSYLLFLEKRIVEMEAFVGALPVLDASEKWSKDENLGLYNSEDVVTIRTKKEPRFKVMVEATQYHPAQVEKWMEDVPVGKWTTTKLSGAIPQTRKNELLARLTKFKDAVKFAREKANSVEVQNVSVADSVLSFLFE